MVRAKAALVVAAALCGCSPARSTGESGDDTDSGGEATGRTTSMTSDGEPSSTSSSGGLDGSSTSTTTAETSTTDGSSSETTDDAPAAGCDAWLDSLLCDDFDDGAIDESVWNVDERKGGQIVADDTHPHSGPGSLHLVLPANDNGIRALITTAMPFSAPNNHFFGRVLFHMQGTAPDGHSFVLRARGKLGDETVQYRLDSNGARFNSRYMSPSADAIQHGGFRKLGYDVPSDAWLCIEWEYDGEANEMRYWMDGELIDDMVVLGDEDPPWTAPSFDSFALGLHNFQPGTAQGYELWFDELVLDTMRVGCP